MEKRPWRAAEHALISPVCERAAWLREQLLARFEGCGRPFPWREPGRPAYEVVVAEILLQRTTASAVARAYTPFLERYPSWPSLAQATREEQWEALRPLGLWRQKADVLLQLARSVEAAGGTAPASRPELERLKGVGPYTASAVLAVAYGQAEPLVDVNTARVLGRFFGLGLFPTLMTRPYTRSPGAGRSARGTWPSAGPSSTLGPSSAGHAVRSANRARWAGGVPRSGEPHHRRLMRRPLISPFAAARKNRNKRRHRA